MKILRMALRVYMYRKSSNSTALRRLLVWEDKMTSGYKHFIYLNPTMIIPKLQTRFLPRRIKKKIFSVEI